MSGKKLISLIIPAYNEEGNIPRLCQEVMSLVESLPNYDFEMLVIDNASTDRTGELASALCAHDPRWKYVRFSRNFGSEASIAAGFRLCTGDACITLFSDLQDPPEQIPNLIKQWENGHDVVYGIYSGNEHEKLWKRWLSARFYGVLKSLSDVPMIPFAGDFRLYDRRVINVLNRLRERNRYMRGLAQWVGFRTQAIHYQRKPRTQGRSKAPFFYLFSFAFSIIVNFSEKPLRVFTVIGLIVSLLSALLLALLIGNIFWQPVLPGLTTTHVLLAANLAFTSLGFGVIGEYLGKVHRETKGRPLWIIDQTIGVDPGVNDLG